MKRTLLFLLMAFCGQGAARAQSVLDRSPNLQGVWTLPRWSPVFVFAHRFEVLEGGDEMINLPTLTLALGLTAGLTVGLDHTTNSEIVPSKLAGNETEYWLKRGVGLGAAGSAAAMVAYNTAAESVDGAISARQATGRVSLFEEVRGFTDLFGSGDPGVAGAVGAAVRLTPYLALTGDVGRVLSADSFPAAWSAAAAFSIPGTPHTFSLQVTNTGATTLQGASRGRNPLLGPDRLRYGFTFTVPLGPLSRWARIFRPERTPAPPD